MSIEGARAIALDPQGNLVVQTSGPDLVQHAPVIYQEIDGERRPVDGSFVLSDDNEVTFRVEAYDTSRPLVIDPVLSYSTYLGGAETALKFVNRGLSLMHGQSVTDFGLYQSLVELRVQVLLVLGREDDALAALEEAREMLPNNPTIAKWIEKLNKIRPRGEA